MRSRASRRNRNRRSRNRRSFNRYVPPRSHHSRSDHRRSCQASIHHAPLLKNSPQNHSPSLPDPPIAQCQWNQASSVVSQALNRITDFWRREPPLSANTSSPILSFDKELVYSKEASTISIEPPMAKLFFHCQLAHGSPTSIVSDFNNPKELYEKIAERYDGITADEILFCTRNTHRIEMDAVLSGSLAINDFIFAHIRGQKKEVELAKEEKLLGVTLSDNWAGRVFIRKIDPTSQLASAQPAIEVGDHIEKINDESMVGKRHYQVANILRSIPIGQTFKLRLISPFKSGFSFISMPSRHTINVKKSMSAVGVGVPQLANSVQTIRFKSVGNAVIEAPPDKLVIDLLDNVFDNYLGFNDEELAMKVLEMGRESSTLVEFEDKVKTSALNGFEFSHEFIFDLWGVVDDWKNNRLAKCDGAQNKDESSNANAHQSISTFDDESFHSVEQNEQMIGLKRDDCDDNEEKSIDEKMLGITTSFGKKKEKCTWSELLLHSSSSDEEDEWVPAKNHKL